MPPVASAAILLMRGAIMGDGWDWGVFSFVCYDVSFLKLLYTKKKENLDNSLSHSNYTGCVVFLAYLSIKLLFNKIKNKKFEYNRFC